MGIQLPGSIKTFCTEAPHPSLLMAPTFYLQSLPFSSLLTWVARGSVPRLKSEAQDSARASASAPLQVQGQGAENLPRYSQAGCVSPAQQSTSAIWWGLCLVGGRLLPSVVKMSIPSKETLPDMPGMVVTKYLGTIKNECLKIVPSLPSLPVCHSSIGLDDFISFS